MTTTVKKYIFERSNSNTYLLQLAKSTRVWLFDLGAFDKVWNALDSRAEIAGVFLTHYHYDHIYGINKLHRFFPDCPIYASEITLAGLKNPKVNLSFYHEDPVTYIGNNGVVPDRMEMEVENNCLHILPTPGHNPGHWAYRLGKYLFTGDAYIPGVNVVTKLKGGNKQQSLASLRLIRQSLQRDTILCPGHGEMVPAKDIIPHLDELIANNE